MRSNSSRFCIKRGTMDGINAFSTDNIIRSVWLSGWLRLNVFEHRRFEFFIYAGVGSVGVE